MKKTFLVFALASFFWNSKATNITTPVKKPEIKVNIDLVNIKDDKVLVTVFPTKIKTDKITFSIPKIIPGTYSLDNYGKFIDNLKAFDKKGKELTVTKKDDNSWSISNAKLLTKITYLVNDTFDIEKGTGFGGDDVFSPTGSNINAGKNILLNTHCFVGYFNDFMAIPYNVTISHPKEFWGATSMTDLDPSQTLDTFKTSNYAELVENPIMYSKPDFTTFTADGMEIQFCVYSPTGKHTAQSITEEMKTMMIAQKKFLGNINTTKKYSVLVYLSNIEENDARGFGALEHPTATTVVFPELMPKDELIKSMMDVVSHEFFHIVTPLTIHSKEIHFFDYKAPKMSEHLWMYEGVTEYFANLFQINQGLITEDEFYKRLSVKIENSKNLNDTMPFTTMSANVLNQPYKDQYINVYEKGALIGMCIDIIIREKSNGEKGILDLMRKLSIEYGVSKPFNDNELFTKITQLTYPEVGEFLKTYVSGTTPIPYETYFAKVGITKSIEKSPASIFIKGETPYINVIPKSKEIIVLPEIQLNEFFTSLGLKGKDLIIKINDIAYNMDNIYDLLGASESWKENDPIAINIKRNGKEEIIKGNVHFPMEDKAFYNFTDNSKEKLKNAWLKN